MVKFWRPAVNESLSCVFQVQTEGGVSAAESDPQVEMGEVNQQLGALERRGVELEDNLRGCKNGTLKHPLLTHTYFR